MMFVFFAFCGFSMFSARCLYSVGFFLAVLCVCLCGSIDVFGVDAIEYICQCTIKSLQVCLVAQNEATPR